jgi:hypothetical protein
MGWAPVSRKVERKRNEMIEGLLQVCHERGITSAHLRKHVLGVYTYFAEPSSENYPVCVRSADTVSSAGLTAQLHALLEAHGDKRLMAILLKTGGILDAIVNHTSSSPAEIEEGIGRYNVDGDGDIE